MEELGYHKIHIYTPLSSTTCTTLQECHITSDFSPLSSQSFLEQCHACWSNTTPIENTGILLESNIKNQLFLWPKTKRQEGFPLFFI